MANVFIPEKVTLPMIDAQRQQVAFQKRELARAKHELRLLQDAYKATTKERTD